MGKTTPFPLRMKGEKMRQRRRRPKKKKKIFMSASAEASEEKTFFLVRGRKDVDSQVLQKPKLQEILFTQFNFCHCWHNYLLFLKVRNVWRIPFSISATLCSEEEQMTLLPLSLLLRCKLRLLPLRPFSSPPFLFLPF